MIWAPEASLEDGIFDIVLVANIPKRKLISESHKIYSGNIQRYPEIQDHK